MTKLRKPPGRFQIEQATYLALIRQTMGDGVVIQHLEQTLGDVDRIAVHCMFAHMREMARSVAKGNFDASYFVAVDWQDATHDADLFWDSVSLSCGSTGVPIFKISLHGSVLEQRVLSLIDPGDPMIAKGLSSQWGTTVFHYSRGEYNVYHSDDQVEHVRDLPTKRFPHARLTSQYRPIEEWSDLLSEHYETCVKEAAQTKHWHSKAARILRSSPEEIFKGSLWWYLNTFTIDAQKVKQEYPVDDGGEKPVDVCVVKEGGREFMFEVKWLGKAVGGKDKKEKTKGKGAEKGDAKAKDTPIDKAPAFWTMAVDSAWSGNNQIIKYLSSNRSAELGCCVVYDGREGDLELDWSLCGTHPKAHHRRFYLVSESPSVQSKREIQEAKKGLTKKD